MAASWSLWVIIAVKAFCCCASFFPAPPSYGDLVLEEYTNQLYINLAPDGNKEYLDYIYPVCADSFQDERDNPALVISRQLGYNICALTPANMNQSRSFGANGIKCTGSEYHIMHCQISSPEIADGLHCDHSVLVSCNSKDSLYYNGSTVGNLAYQGQVLLHPHSPTGRGIATASMGMVGVKEEGDGCYYWRFIEIQNHIDWTLANTLCRQMGFTHVNSALLKQDAESLYNYDYSEWIERISPSTLLSSDISCGKTSHECLGCCNYTLYDKCSDDTSSNLQTISDIGSILVLRCSFFRDEQAPSEGGSKCGFHKTIIKATCDQGLDQICERDKVFLSITTVPGGVLLVLCVVLIVVIVTMCIHRRCQRCNGQYQQQINQ